MTNVEIGIASIAVILVFIQLGMHVAIALMSVSFIGVYLVKGKVVMFDVAGQLFRRFRGGLGIATVFANAIFAAVNGTSIASASVFTKVAVPELIRQGYTARFSVGVVAGSSVLGMLIPPSLLLNIDGRPLMSTGTMVARAAPIAVLIVLVLGGIYGGFFTPTEAGGVGALGALIIAQIKGGLGLKVFGRILLETGQVTASITFLIIAAHMYSRLLALTGLPNAMTDLLSAWNLGLFGILILYLIAIVLLGTILDSSSILLILLPLILPVVEPFSIDMVWFGIVTIVAVEVGLLTPPLGVACFVIKANLDDDRITLNDIFAGAAPFALIMVALIGLLLMFPELATVLL